MAVMGAPVRMNCENPMWHLHGATNKGTRARVGTVVAATRKEAGVSAAESTRLFLLWRP